MVFLSVSVLLDVSVLHISLDFDQSHPENLSKTLTCSCLPFSPSLLVTPDWCSGPSFSYVSPEPNILVTRLYRHWSLLTFLTRGTKRGFSGVRSCRSLSQRYRDTGFYTYNLINTWKFYFVCFVIIVQSDLILNVSFILNVFSSKRKKGSFFYSLQWTIL